MSPAFYPYSSDSDERQRFIAHATLLSVLLIWLIHLANGALVTKAINIPWFIELPTFAGLTWGIYHGAAHLTWRYKWFRALFRVQIPDLNGTWEGYLVSSFDPSKRIKCTLIIEQAWDSIGLIFETDQSRSCNGITGFAVKSPGGARLVYEYTNVPSAIAATDSMHHHEGTQWLTLSEDGAGLKLEGDYYTGRDRRTYGSVEMRRISVA